ncbi:MAG: anti-sigma factor [Planctomycetaceae bacterium]|nr:anti-sigma factor [Planctomycetaceae bacterium]
MNCRELQQQLERAVERRLSPPFDDWRDHLNRCESCRKLCADHQLLERAVGEWSGIETAPDLSDRVLASLENHDNVSPAGAHHPPERAGLFFLFATIAAVILVVIVMQNRDVPDEPNVMVKTDIHTPPPEEVPEVDMQRVLDETRSAYESLLGQAQSTITPLKKAVVTDNNLSPAPENIEKPERRLIPRELEPLRTEMTQSFGFLTALLPETGT